MSVNAKWGGRRREGVPDKTKSKRRERKSCDHDDSLILKDKSEVRGDF